MDILFVNFGFWQECVKKFIQFLVHVKRQFMIYITALPQLYDPSTEGRYRTDEEMDTINQRVAMAIAGQNIFGKYGGDGQGHPDSKVNSH